MPNQNMCGLVGKRGLGKAERAGPIPATSSTKSVQNSLFRALLLFFNNKSKIGKKH